MSPPTPVFSRRRIQERYKAQLNDPDTYKCSLKSLVQQECTFKLLSEESRVVETICIPFKRLFQRCLLPHTRVVNGRKIAEERWVNIEVTLAETNDAARKSFRELDKFMDAEVELKKWFEQTREES